MTDKQLKVWNSVVYFLHELVERSQFDRLVEAAKNTLKEIENNPANKVEIVKNFLNSIINRNYYFGHYEETTAAKICLKEMEEVNL
jgi:hypothetical protein